MKNEKQKSANGKAEKPAEDGKKPSSYGLTLGICIGMMLGVALGVCLNNLALWMPIGICIGTAVGIAIDHTKQNKKPETEKTDGEKIETEKPKGEDEDKNGR